MSRAHPERIGALVAYKARGPRFDSWFGSGVFVVCTLSVGEESL